MDLSSLGLGALTPAGGAAAGGGLGSLMSNPTLMALLGGGLGMMQAAGPSTQKTGLGGAIGAGMGGAISGLMGVEAQKRQQQDDALNRILMQIMAGQLGTGTGQAAPGSLSTSFGTPASGPPPALRLPTG